MKYRYATWCRYCIGANSDEAICDAFPEYSDETFDTPEEAQRAAKDCCDNNQDYKVVDENYEEVIQEEQGEKSNDQATTTDIH